MDPLSFVITFGGLVVGASGTPLVYLERTKGYRDVLYTMQLKAATDLVDSAQLLYRRVDEFETTLAGVTPDPRQMAKFRDAFEALVKAARKDLGVDPLSVETLHLIGTSENTPNA